MAQQDYVIEFFLSHVHNLRPLYHYLADSEFAMQSGPSRRLFSNETVFFYLKKELQITPDEIV
jgi:hypothetical protein